MQAKAKAQDQALNPLIPPSIDIDHTPLAGKYYQITERLCECDFLELYYWLDKKHTDKIGEMISSTLTNTSMYLSKLQVSFANV